MALVIRTKPFQNLISLFLRRLFHRNRLETALKCCILLNIFAVFLQGGSSNDLQLPSGKRWLQNVGSIQCSLCPSCSDNGMKLVNKQKDSLILPYFIYHLADSLLELASVFASSHHSGKIQHNQSFVPDGIRHGACDNPLCQSLSNGCFAHAWLSHQTGIVLGSAA